jgi:hypothetical protein
MAIMWQNPELATWLMSKPLYTPGGKRNQRLRKREDVIAKYWQRYCGKNDSAGFFGPVCWTSVGDSGPTVRARPGTQLIRETVVHFEWWALMALVERLAEDPAVRAWMPVCLQPHLFVRDGHLHAPDRPAQPLTPAVSALLSACDGRVTLSALAGQLTAAGHYHRPGDVWAQVDDLCERGVLWVGVDLPIDLSAEAVLGDYLETIGDPDVRARAHEGFSRLLVARDAAAAAPDAEALGSALAALDETFVAVTGREPRHRAGQMYAGRTLCHIEASRDLDLAFGPHLLGKLSALEPLLHSARWLTGAVAEAYSAVFGELYRELAEELGTAQVPLNQLWYLAQGVVFGKEPPSAPVNDEFLRRWNALLGVDDAPAGCRELRYTREEVSARVAEAFPDRAPGWWQGRIHSPDLHICAPDLAAVERGDYRIVLGELHIGMPTLDTDFFRLGHPDPARLAEALLRDAPDSRVELLRPDDWPRNCARNAKWIRGSSDVQLGFAQARGADRTRLVHVTGLVVAPGPAGLAVHAGDGRSWPLLEIFAELLEIQTSNTWKLAGRGAHAPRVVVDDLVIMRETWRTTVGATGLADPKGEYDRFIAARRWRRALGLPERIFIQVWTETKPVYVDLSSPLFVRQLCNLIRGARERFGADVELSITEMLPDTRDAWVSDVDGQRYASELRLHICDWRTPPYAGAETP